MHKQYPYLQDSYIYQTDVEQEKRNILAEIDNFLNQRQYVKITLLDWDEEPIKEIEGEISSGTLSKNGDSPIRRTCQLTCAVDARSYSVDDGKADFAINKKIFIEIGIKNETDYYTDYPIFWFPEGVFFIGSFSINASSNSSTVITLSLKDKMAMLNGDVGGTLPATTIFDSMDTQLPSGEYIEKKVLIYNIIKEAVNHYGGEDLNRIVIEGVPLRIRRIMQWVGDTPLYQVTTAENFNSDNNELTGNFYEFTTNSEDSRINDTTPKFEKGDDVGYIMDDFVIVDELTGAPGETVTSILDKIKNIIGNYEYFYDVFGVFHFREIKNYYVTTQARTLLDEMRENDYLVEVNNNKSIYTFDDEKLLTSITVNPQYENIKNDYIIEGQTTIGDDTVYPIRYHLAIDNKPKTIGVDTRLSIRKRIDNSEEIEEKTEELKNLYISQNSSKKILEDLLYKIRNAKTYILNQKALIDTKDKELLKEFQDFNNTAFTYEELEQIREKKENGIVLLSEAFIIRQNYNKPATDANETLINSYIKHLNNSYKQQQLENEKTEKEALLDTYSSRAALIESQIKDKEQWAKENKQKCQDALTDLKLKIETLTAEISILSEKIELETERGNIFKDNAEILYDFILDTQKNIEEREKKLFGSAEKNIVQNWKVNYYDTLVQRNTDKIIFSHNTERFDLAPKDNNVYDIWTEDGLTLKKKILTDDDQIFYEKSFLHDFLLVWLEYYNSEEGSNLSQITELENSIAALEDTDGNFINKNNPNQNTQYYEIYPDRTINENSLQEMVIYTHPRNGLVSAAYAKILNNETLPEVGNFNLLYKELKSNIEEKDKYYYWDGQMYQEVDILEVYDNTAAENQYYAYDWRTKLYLDGLKGVINGTDQGYYFAELSAFWPQVYDLIEQKFYGQKEDENIHYKTLASQGTYYLDFLDSTSTSFGEWSVDNIGRRSDVIVKEEINCLFQPEIPNVILLPANTIDLNLIGYSLSDEIYSYGTSLESEMTLEELRKEARTNFYPWTQVSSEIYSNLMTGGYKNGAFDQIKYELYLHTRYQKSVSLTAIPVFYLEPNNRITINDTTTNTYGDFVIQSINLTLGPGANMSVTCNETAERF